MVVLLDDGYISWRSILQICGIQSTTKVEYVAKAKVAKHTIWLDRFITKMRLKYKVVSLDYNSQNAINFVAN